MSSTSDASAGGAGGAAGVGFQSRVFAWAASCIVAEEPLVVPLVAGDAVVVGAQTGSEVDDVVVLTNGGNSVFVQAKIKLKLSADIASPLVKGLRQAVRQYLVGTVTGGDSGPRQVDFARDAIVLCTDHAAPATIRVELATAISRVASHPTGTVLGAELNKKEQKAFGVALTHIRRLWAAEKDGAEPADEDVRKFLKCLHVLSLDLGDGGKDQQAAISVLHRGLEAPVGGIDAWKVLVDAGQVASERREWRDRAALTLAMAQQGVTTTVSAKYASDIAVVRERSASNLAALQSEALLPVDGGLFIARSVAKTLRDLESRDPILVVGNAGSGKSGVLQDLATARRETEEVVVLLAADVAGANRLATRTPLREVLQGWTGPPGLVVIDGVDALRGSGDRETLSNTVAALAGTRWQVVASARSFDTKNSRPLQKAFAGFPVSSAADEIDKRLTAVRHLLVGDLSDEDLDREIVAPMPLATLLAEAPPDLRALLCNPFNLRLAAELAASLTTSQHDELLRVRSRVELLGRYWDWRIRSENAQAREALLQRLVEKMVADRRLHVEQKEPTVFGTDSLALEDMLSHGVLTSLEGPVPGLSRVVGFSHNILFDYATAIYVLYHQLEPSGLVKILNEDPTLPLVARPSFDLLVEMLWQARTSGEFWPTALAIAGSGHILGSLAVAARVANLATDGDDLLELATADTEAIDGAMSGRQHLASQLTGAVRARAVVPDAERVAVPLAHLARRLAVNADSSYTDGALATDLILALQSRVPIGSVDGDIGEGERAQTIAVLLDACRSDPSAREPLVGALIRQVEYVVARSEEVRDAVRRVLDDFDALAQWGGTVTTWFPEIAVKALRADPDLAHRLAVTSMTFEETREEDVSLGGSSVLPLRESRKQQAKHAAYRLGEVFPELASTDVGIATAIICSIIEHIEPTGLERAAQHRENASKWPMATSNLSGWIEPDYGFGLSTYWHDDEQKMLKAVADALVDASEAMIARSLDLFVANLHRGWAWAALMNHPLNPAHLFRVLQPVFSTGTLLAHPRTYTQAARLLKAATDEGMVPHKDLESAVSKAIELLETYDRGDHIKDVLVGCLDRTAVTSVSLASRLDALGDEVPEIPSPPSMETEVRAWSTVDHLHEEGFIPSPEVEEAARALEQALNDAREDKTNSAELVARLIRTFVDAHAVFSSEESTHPRLDHMLLDGAVRLAYLPEITPEHPVGPLAFQVLDMKADDADVGRFLS
jgi:hypothetical protein